MPDLFEIGPISFEKEVCFLPPYRRPIWFDSYSELTFKLMAWAEAYPDLTRLMSIGKTHRGRDLWLMTLTDKTTGPAEHKPGFYIDGGTHAEELTGTEVAMATISHLLTKAESDPTMGRLLASTAFYILPRVNPDGAEFVMQEGRLWVGNGRYLPGEEQPHPGFYFDDVNDDGIIAQMRIEDPLGEWRVSERDPRLLVARPPEMTDGTFYRLLPEGRIRNGDGTAIALPRPRDGNINRNFPANWLPEHRQYGAGAYPLSEPEAHAIATFFLEHPNIFGAQFYHTHGGVILRPFLDKPDRAFPPGDQALFEAIGKRGEALTGYPLISVYEAFTSDPDTPRTGTAMEWAYEQQGILCYSTELWDVEKAAGTTREDLAPDETRSEERDLRLLAWLDHRSDLMGYLPWEPVEHPELGRVEVGGWNRNVVFRNAPPDLLGELSETNIAFTLAHVGAGPRLTVESVTLTPVEGRVYQVAAVVANTGYLPTHVTEMARREGQAPGVEVTLSGRDLTYLSGPSTFNIGDLSGRAERDAVWSPFGPTWGSPRDKVQWVVEIPEGTETLEVRARTPRAGRALKRVRVKG